MPLTHTEKTVFFKYDGLTFEGNRLTMIRGFVVEQERAKKFQGTVGPLLQHMNAMQNVERDKTYKAVISGQLSEINTVCGSNRFATVSASSITDSGFENHEVTITDLHFRMAGGATMIRRRPREEDENNNRQDKRRQIDDENDTILSNGIDEEQHENVVEDEDIYEERNDYIYNI
ncbi:hypothetical protein BDB00DRAFT_880249 [Zychaea mexicana]|uniref:uncharacterized protein n=1 Tax=Zychaea mexicana TaxID=64656 RepID=UPI0022FE54EB|nr:uncharacterized protein BDB00DRAFT_880249 [Zychaea mexicana]KAI9469140.1 hypothetical protein BDB00DRAFT_880249 [Zychaea mexicana]